MSRLAQRWRSGGGGRGRTSPERRETMTEGLKILSHASKRVLGGQEWREAVVEREEGCAVVRNDRQADGRPVNATSYSPGSRPLLNEACDA